MTLGKGVYRSRRATDPVCVCVRSGDTLLSRAHAALTLAQKVHSAAALRRGAHSTRVDARPGRASALAPRRAASVCFPTKLPIYEIGVTSALASANQLCALSVHLISLEELPGIKNVYGVMCWVK